MADAERTPHPGDALLIEGTRLFLITGVDPSVRGFWFTARAADGATALQANYALAWDDSKGLWVSEGGRLDPSSSARRHPVRLRRAREGADGGNVS
jgi:hypothetical protein